MTTVLVVDADDAIRRNIVHLLRSRGCETPSVSNGRLALEQVAGVRPDIVIADVALPGMDGFALVEAIRSDRAAATAPWVLLTGPGDRASVRRGMTAGADDYLAKPFTSSELLEAVSALLKKRARFQGSIEAAVRQQDELGRDLPLTMNTGEVDATVLFADIRNFTALAEKLSSAETAELLSAYFGRICRPVLQNGGWCLKFTGDGLMSVFTDDAPHGSPLPAARRAVAAALGIALATREFRGWIEQRFGERELPPFAAGAGLHAGEVTFCRFGALGVAELTVVGDTVNVAARLEAAAKDLGWTVVASSAVVQRAGGGIQTGASMRLELRGKTDIVEVAEITGIATVGADTPSPPADLPSPRERSSSLE